MGGGYFGARFYDPELGVFLSEDPAGQYSYPYLYCANNPLSNFDPNGFWSIGFKLFSIKPGSIYSKLGMKNGDVIQKINGYEMNSPDKALEIYQKLRDASSVNIDLLRRGQSVQMGYNIDE
mgnify:CR=1 FL=1